MIPQLRHAFNAAFTAERYNAYLRSLDEACGMRVGFRISETPVFLPSAFEKRLFDAAREILDLAMAPAYRALSGRSFPPRCEAPNENAHPEFVQVDFAVVDSPDGTDIRLIELQGFPSIYGFQELMGRVAREQYGFTRLRHLAAGYSADSYHALLRRVILNGHPPEHVVLLEVDPLHQKTRPDFLVTEQVAGIRTVDISTVEKRGRELYYRDERGKAIRILRIYNRAIIDEIERRTVPMAFRFTDDLAVEWACHPNWFYRISKFSLPFLAHPAVPATRFLDDLPAVPDDLENYVLKPLYSFAGGGVIVGPAAEDVRAVPDALRHAYLLQRRVEYADALLTPEGGTKMELRVMIIWDEEPVPVMLLVRTGRGKMMGVNFNTDLRWVGATCALIED